MSCVPILHSFLSIGIGQFSIYNAPQPHYNSVPYNTILDITGLEDGIRDCIDYIENDSNWSFFCIQSIHFVLL